MPVPANPWWLAVALFGLAGLALFAYTLRVLDAWGSTASFLLGLEVALLGGLGWMLLMVLFTGLGFVATRIGYERKRRRRVAEDAGGERGVRNVLGNGAAAGLVAAASLAPIPAPAVQAAFAAAIAAVAADTLASEVGVLSGRARSILPPFARVRAGANGGVSLLGQGAALLGAGLIAAAAVPLVGLPPALALVAAAAGFAGCQVDSLLGATLEGGPGRRGGLGKQWVNFLASLLPAGAVLAILWAWPVAS